MRDRITITIRDDVLKQVDRSIDGLSIRSRSQAIEFLLTKLLSDFKLKNALVLAGGKNSAKFLLDLKGKTLLERVIEQINSFHVSNFLVYTDFMKEKIKKEFEGRRLPYNLQFIESVKPSGTIEPLLKAKNYLNDTFLLAYGDTLCSLNLNEMLSFHRKNNSIATIALTTVSNPKEYGVALLEGEKIRKFTQKPKKGTESFLVNAGFMLFEPEIFKHISREMHSLESNLLPKLAEKNLLHGYSFQGMYLNINTKEDYEKAKMIL